MIHGYTVSRSFRKLVMALGLALMITNVSVAVVALQAQTALTLALPAEDPAISFSAVMGTLPVWEEVKGGSQLVYFNNQSAGVLSVTFEISGTPNLSLTAGAAFGDPEQIFTSTSSPWKQVVTYSVEPGGGDYPGIAYTATNTNGVASTLVIDYRRDVTYNLYLPVVLKNYPPTPTGLLSINHGSASTYNLTVTLQITDTTDGDSIARVRFKNEGGSWGAWQDFAPDYSFNLSSGNGLKTVYAQPLGAQGGLGEITATILLFENGDFTSGLSNWQNSGTLGALPQTDGSAPISPPHIGQLGSPDFACANGVPVGFGSLMQNLSIPAAMPGQVVKLKFNYRLFSNDRNRNLTDDYDSFDVLVNGLRLFRDANTQSFNYCAVAPYDLGWKSGSISLSGPVGSIVPIDFRVYNRPDGYYNTYVYLDDVRIVIEP